MDFVSVIDAQFRKATRDGAFEGLPQEGAPLEGLERNTVDVWLEGRLSEEGLSLPLPPGLQVRKDVEHTLATLRHEKDEAHVRAELEKLNAKIYKANRLHTRGPSSGLCTLDVDAWVRAWRRDRFG